MISAGQYVEWTMEFGEIARGRVVRIDDGNGRIYIETEVTNRRGRKRTRSIVVWFDAHETDRLRVYEPTSSELRQ